MVDFSVNRIRQGIAAQGQAGHNAEQYSKLYRETAIQAEIAAKAVKLPDPNVWVDPKAITRMAEDKDFYNMVMSKINAFTSNPDISLHYPHITYSLIVEEDGDWKEIMVNEELKKRSEEAANNDGDKSIFDMLQIATSSLAATRNSFPIEVMYDYSKVQVDSKKRSQGGSPL